MREEAEMRKMREEEDEDEGGGGRDEDEEIERTLSMSVEVVEMEGRGHDESLSAAAGEPSTGGRERVEAMETLVDTEVTMENVGVDEVELKGTEWNVRGEVEGIHKEMIKAEEKARKIRENSYSWGILECWIQPLIQALLYKEIEPELWDVRVKRRIGYSSNKFSCYWNEELDKVLKRKKSKPSVLMAAWKTFWKDIMLAGVLAIVWGVLMVYMNTYLVHSFILEAKDKERKWNTNLILLFFLIPIVLGPLLHQSKSISVMVGVRLRAALHSKVFEKALVAELVPYNSIPVSLLLAKDCGVLQFFPLALVRLVSSIIYLVLLCISLSVWFSWKESIVCGGIVFLFLILQLLIDFFSKRFHMHVEETIGERGLIFSQVMNAFRSIKLFSWEDGFKKRLSLLKGLELRYLSRIGTLNCLNVAAILSLPTMLLYIIVQIYYESQSSSLKPEIIYLLVSITYSMRFPLLMLPASIRILRMSKYSLSKIRVFLVQPDMVSLPASENEGLFYENADISPHSSTMDGNLDIHWSVDHVKRPSSSIALRNVKFEVLPGEVTAVIGDFGSGKSLLLNAALGHAQVLHGEIKVRGKMAYISETPWFFHGSIRENILFGHEFESAWYFKVLDACCLLPDIQKMSERDLTILIDKGNNVSVGQRQKIALARAVYSKSDVYIVDDLFSSLDAETSSFIFDKVFLELLSKSAVLFVTQDTNIILKSHKLLCIRDSSIYFFGRPSSEIIEEFKTNYDNDVGSNKFKDTNAQSDMLSRQINADKEPSDEGTAVDFPFHNERLDKRSSISLDDLQSVSLSSMLETWMRFMGFPMVILFLVFFIFIQSMNSFLLFWLRFWLNNVISNLSSQQYLFIFVEMVFLMFVFLFIGGFFWYRRCNDTSFRLHEYFLSKVFWSPLSFFTKNDPGKVVKAYLSDNIILDSSVPEISHRILILISITITSVFSMIACLDVFIIETIIVVSFWVFLIRYFGKSYKVCKFSIAQADTSMLVHNMEALRGVATIRAFKKEKLLLEENSVLWDSYGAAIFRFENFALYTTRIFDLVLAMYVLIAIVLSIALRKFADGEEMGILITNLTQCFVFCGFMISSFHELQLQLVSANRIQEFIKSAHSESKKKQINLPLGSGHAGRRNFLSGCVEFKNVTFSHSYEDSLFKDLSFSIADKERWCIIGNTGSGKSSLISVLFRLFEISSGEIKVDHFDSTTLYVRDLRQCLCIVPQDPLLFRGSIRSNLDPFNDHTEIEIWNALSEMGLKSMVEGLPGGLDSEIAEFGCNLSIGQRQLLCLVRAVLSKDRRIIVLDRSTSHLDSESESIVLKRINEIFSSHSIISLTNRITNPTLYDKIALIKSSKLEEVNFSS